MRKLNCLTTTEKWDILRTPASLSVVDGLCIIESLYMEMSMNIKTMLMIPSMCIIIASACFGMSYRVTDIGKFMPAAINNKGQVVGTSGQQAVIWDSVNGLRHLGTLGGYGSTAADINDLGQVVGNSRTSDNYNRAFLWQNNTMQDLGTFGVSTDPRNSINYSWARGINNNGQVVGSAGTSNGYEHAALWQNGGIQDLGTINGSESIAEDINDSGQIVGIAYVSSGGGAAGHAFFWDKGSMLDLNMPGDNFSEAVAINNIGQIIGDSINGNYSPCVSSIWPRGQFSMQYLTYKSSHACGINNNGQVVGYYNAPDQSSIACVWQNGTMIDLPGWGVYDNVAFDINDQGVIVGYSVGHAVLWTPVPEPSSILLLAGGIAGFALRRKIATRAS